MKLTIQIFEGSAWVDAATVEVLDTKNGGVNTKTFFEYEWEYAFGANKECVALDYPVSATLTQLDSWPAFLYDLVPQGNGRKYLLGLIGKNDGAAADFDLLKAGAFNPIGRTRVKEAHQYYLEHLARHDTGDMDKGMSIEEIIGKKTDFVERMKVQGMLEAGTTGVQGAAPKFLLTKDVFGKWYADGQIDDARAAAHYIVKLPRGKEVEDLKVLKNEAAYLKTAHAMGVHATEGVEMLGNMLFVPRFDRAVKNGKVLRHHQESLASLVGLVGYDRRPGQFELLKALRRVVTDKTKNTLEFLKRDVLNLAMRNTDNHARNTAVQMIKGEVALTPLYDFAPMYLDPEGIARAARWYHPGGNNEMHQWEDILMVLKTAGEITSTEHGNLLVEMSKFGRELENLPGVMLTSGVDADIVNFLRPSIEKQRAQLTDLAVISGTANKRDKNGPT